jgi:hypothetical protein
MDGPIRLKNGIKLVGEAKIMNSVARDANGMMNKKIEFRMPATRVFSSCSNMGGLVSFLNVFNIVLPSSKKGFTTRWICEC